MHLYGFGFWSISIKLPFTENTFFSSYSYVIVSQDCSLDVLEGLCL